MAGVEVPSNKFVVGAQITDESRVGELGPGASPEEVARLRNGYNAQLLDELRALRDFFQTKKQEKIVSESLGDHEQRRMLAAHLLQAFGPEPLVTVTE